MEPSVTTRLKISGMHCGGCASAVRAALLAVPGVVSAEVSLADGLAQVEYDRSACAPEALVTAIQSRQFGAEILA